MESAMLQGMMDLIDEQDFAYDSVLVIRHAHIVFEQYRNGYDQNRKHHLQSVTKSFSSMLIGIALHEGLLGGIQQKMVDLFPDHTIAILDTRKADITLENMLTMSDGMDWHELDYPYSDPRNSLGQMWVSQDAIQHILDTPMARNPGESWAYNSGMSILLGGILEQAAGQDVLDFARQYLFDPIGIGDVRWEKTASGHYHTDGGLYMTPRDMARFGYLMLQDGNWDDEEIVSPEWVEDSTRTHYQTSSGNGYGYQWWTLGQGVFAATGHYEQNIYMVPEAELVVVFTGYIPDEILHPTEGLMYRYILAACTDLPYEATHQTYEDNGLTFEYPTGFKLTEIPLPETGKIDAGSGLLQLRLDSCPFEIVQVMWRDAEPGLDPYTYREELFGSLSLQAGIEYTTGTSWESTKDQHTTFNQYFDYAGQGIQLRGVTGVWYCNETGRVIAFNYATNPEVSDQALESKYQEHLDSFACHDGG